jgi:hypothetical protein
VGACPVTSFGLLRPADSYTRTNRPNRQIGLRGLELADGQHSKVEVVIQPLVGRCKVDELLNLVGRFRLRLPMSNCNSIIYAVTTHLCYYSNLLLDNYDWLRGREVTKEGADGQAFG